jgi:TolB-like protein
LKKQSHFLMLFATVMILLQVFSAPPTEAAPLRVAILPFDVHAEKDMTFLQEGILDMLTSRLAWQDKVDVINKSEVRTALTSIVGLAGESRALLAGSKLQANYVLSGSLTVIGKNVSIDAKMMTVNDRRLELPFFAQTNDMGGVVPEINQFATNINETVFGRSADKRAIKGPASQSNALPVVQNKSSSQIDESRMHPEKLLLSGVEYETQGQTANQPNNTPNPAFIAATPTSNTGNSSRTFWKSRKMKALITGLDIADVDNDGRQEVIISSEQLVSIYRVENQRLVKTAETAKTRTGSYISVDVADINGNGTPEIYVSSLEGNRTTVDSFILEYANNEYKKISDDNNWFYRVTHTNDKGAILLGQRQRMGEKSIFNGAIHEMIWQDDRLVPGRQLLKGGKANLMGVTCGDIAQSGQSTILAYSDWNRIRVYNNSGEVIWEDGNRTGGNTEYFNLPKIEPGQPNQQFFPLRIRIVHIDQDSRPEVLIARHDELANSMLQNFRSFSKAKLESMEWDGLGLVPKWKTQTLGGRIGDFVVGDFDNDGSDELVIAMISKERAVAMADAASYLIAFDLTFQ